MILKTLWSKDRVFLGAADARHPDWGAFVKRHKGAREIEIDIPCTNPPGIDPTIRQTRLRHLGNMQVVFESCCPHDYRWDPIK